MLYNAGLSGGAFRFAPPGDETMKICIGAWGKTFKGFYFRPVWLNSVTWKKDDIRIYRWGWFHISI